MLKIIPFSLGICLLTLPVYAQEMTQEQLMKSELEQNKVKINEIFQDKVQKISTRRSLPEEMRGLLLSQADEVRQFDIDMLEKKMALKQRHAHQRDELKERLRKDAQNRVKWMLEDETDFQKNKETREKAEQAVLKEVKQIQEEGKDKSPKK